ncbi:MAG: hypothetical protein JKX84_00665 [Flavobacteriales bacterium]|nr:hypothetical protein [Flavobacteriales bacterium]
MKMGKLGNILMLSCRKVTELMEEKIHVKLSVVERVQLSLHSKMCPGCSEYENQSKLIDEALGSSTSTSSKKIENVDVLKSKILANLKK